jgi:hypothetical protein
MSVYSYFASVYDFRSILSFFFVLDDVLVMVKRRIRRKKNELEYKEEKKSRLFPMCD